MQASCPTSNERLLSRAELQSPYLRKARSAKRADSLPKRRRYRAESHTAHSSGRRLSRRVPIVWCIHESYRESRATNSLDAGRIAGMHAGFFNVLHDAADDHVGSVGEGIHVHFRGFLEELINEHRPGRTHEGGLRDIFLNGVHVVGNHHRTTTQDVAWAPENRQTDFPGDARSFFRHESGPIARLRNFQLIEQAAEPAAVFSKINRFRGRADNGHAVALQFERKIQRGLPAKLYDHALRFFALDDG